MRYILVTNIFYSRLLGVNQFKSNIMKTTYVTPIERGILTSAYKREIRESIRVSKRESLSKFKNIIEDHHARVQSKTGTILQVSLFALAMILVII